AARRGATAVNVVPSPAGSADTRGWTSGGNGQTGVPSAVRSRRGGSSTPAGARAEGPKSERPMPEVPSPLGGRGRATPEATGTGAGVGRPSGPRVCTRYFSYGLPWVAR